MPINVYNCIGGSTYRATWVSSGVAPSQISSALYDKTDTLVSSITATSSGNGFYYADHLLPNTRAWFVNKWHALVGVNTYDHRQFVRAVLPEVD